MYCPLFDRIFKRFTCFEGRNFACRDFDIFFRTWVATFTGSALTNFKSTKTDQLNFITVLECFSDRFESSFYNLCSFFFETFAFSATAWINSVLFITIHLLSLRVYGINHIVQTLI